MTTAVRKTVCPESRFISPRKPGAAVADDLAPGGVDDRDLALDDRDEGVAAVADLVQPLADLGAALLAVLGEGLELGGREDAADREIGA